MSSTFRSTLLRLRAAIGLGVAACLVSCGGGGSAGGGGDPGGGGGTPPPTYSLSATISGLTEAGLVLTVNGTSVSVSSGATIVTLMSGLPTGRSYTVSVSTQPNIERCSVANGSGVVNAADVTGISVTCINMEEPQIYGTAGRDIGGPSDGTLPSSGNVTVTLVSDPGDEAGDGESVSFSNLNSTIRVGSGNGWLLVTIDGAESWAGFIHLPAGENVFETKTYTDLPFGYTLDGTLAWSHNDRHCIYSRGTVTVNSVTYVAGAMTAIDLNFDARCYPIDPAGLHGHVVWSADGSSVVPAPIDPPPASLWRPAAGTTPASGNFVYLESDVEDWVGQGLTLTFTPPTSQFAAPTEPDGMWVIAANGDHHFQVRLQALAGHQKLQPGYYRQVPRWQTSNRARGGLSADLDFRGCNNSMGWFVVDSVTYTSGLVTALDARFEQHCEYWRASARGQIHWRADQFVTPPGPTAIPAGLWQAPAAALPATGDYVYLEGDAGDAIFPGNMGPTTSPGVALYTPDTASIKAVTGTIVPGPGVTVSVRTATDDWMGNFLSMYSLDQLEAGYYGPLPTSYDPTIGTEDWSGNGMQCAYTTGWMAVDHIRYSAGVLTGLDLRFEQHCEGASAALHGQVHWGTP